MQDHFFRMKLLPVPSIHNDSSIFFIALLLIGYCRHRENNWRHWLVCILIVSAIFYIFWVILTVSSLVPQLQYQGRTAECYINLVVKIASSRASDVRSVSALHCEECQRSSLWGVSALFTVRSVSALHCEECQRSSHALYPQLRTSYLHH